MIHLKNCGGTMYLVDSLEPLKGYNTTSELNETIFIRDYRVLMLFLDYLVEENILENKTYVMFTGSSSGALAAF